MRNFWDFHENDYRILYVLHDMLQEEPEDFFLEVWASELGPQGSMHFMEQYNYRYATTEEEDEYRRAQGILVPV